MSSDQPLSKLRNYKSVRIFDMKAIIEPSHLIWLLAGYKVRKEFDLFAYTLLYDQIYAPLYDPKETDVGILGSYLSTIYTSLAIDNMISQVSGETGYSNVSDPYREPFESSEGVLILLHGFLLYAKKEKLAVIVSPRHFDGFIDFCLGVEPDFLPALKHSFLINEICMFIFNEYLQSADVRNESVFSLFQPFKRDFQDGIMAFSKEFTGSYSLNQEQKEYIKRQIAERERRVLDYLAPKNLKKMLNVDITKIVGTAGDTALTVATAYPIPLGIFIDICKKLYTYQKFKSEGLNFALSIIILRQLFNIRKPEVPSKCILCAISDSEIRNLPDDDKRIEEIVSGASCELHVVAYLDLRKKYQLMGKQLLLAMKRFRFEDLFRELS